jgi:hypothetical protein
MPAPEKADDAARRKQLREAPQAESMVASEDATPQDAEESESEPLAKRVKLSGTGKRRERHAIPVKGNVQNGKKCRYCKKQGTPCWRQAGPHPRSS